MGDDNLIVEGQAKTRLPKGVFYNPVQEFNRDLTIAVISEYGKVLREEKAAKLKRKSRKGITQGHNNSVKPLKVNIWKTL